MVVHRTHTSSSSQSGTVVHRPSGAGLVLDPSQLAAFVGAGAGAMRPRGGSSSAAAGPAAELLGPAPAATGALLTADLHARLLRAYKRALLAGAPPYVLAADVAPPQPG